MSGTSNTENELREVLETLAGQVHAAPGAYRATRGDWIRRERRRRLVLAVLITVVFSLAILIGLLVLDHAPSSHSGIFNGAYGAYGTSTAHRPDLVHGVPAADAV